MRFLSSLLLAAVLALAGATSAQAQTVDSVSPAPNAIGVAPYATIEVTFAGLGSVTASDFSASDLYVFGAQTGRCQVDGASIAYDQSTSTLSFQTVCAFKTGELVSVTVPANALAPLTEPFTWQFTVEARYGTGEFQRMSGSPVASAVRDAAKSVDFPVSLFAGEINDDLLPDLVHLNRASGELTVRINNGDGSFTAQPQAVGRATNVVGGDLDGSIGGAGRGALDLVLNDALGNTLEIVQNDGSGALTSAGTIQTGSRPTAVEIADLNRDGALDIAVAAFGEDRVYVHLNDGSGNFPNAQRSDYAVGAAPSDLLARDMDNDGDLDVVVASLGAEQIDYLENDGAGGFSSGGAFPLSFSPGALAARDVVGNASNTYGDGWTDLVVAEQDGNNVRVYQHDGDPTTFDFTEAASPSTSAPARDLVLADIDTTDATAESLGLGDDVDLDLLSAHPNGDRMRVYLNEANTTFDVPSDVPTDYDTGFAPTGIVAADFDRDSDMDVALVASDGSETAVFFNTGERPPPIEVEPEPPTPLDCGTVCLGESSTRDVRITSTTDRPVDVTVQAVPSGVFVPDANAFTIQPGETRTVTVTFSPTDPLEYAADLEITAEEQTTLCGEPATELYETAVPLIGTGGATDLTANPTTLTFEELVVGESSTQSFTVTNSGTIEATVDNIVPPNDPPFAVSPTSVVSIASESSETFQVTFAPDQAGNFQDEVRIELSDTCGETETIVVTLEGEAVPPLPDLDVPALSPNSAIEDVLTGAQRSFEADVRNRFFDVSTSFVTRFELPRPDGTTQAAGATTLGTLAADQQQTVQSDAVTFNAPGEYTLCAIADADAQVEESDEANNTNCLTIPVRTPQPDLVAEELVLAESEEGTLDDVLISQTRRFECRFANRGDVGASVFTVAVFRGDESITSRLFGPLAVGSSATLTEADVTFPETGTAQVRCVVDTGEEIAELSEDNNEITQSVAVDTREVLTVRPNPFTPNDDGFNDRVQFEVAEFGLNQPTLKVFSFEGRLIRTVDTVVGGNLEWDGRDDGDQAQPPGVYLYLVEEGGQTAASGHVTLAR